MILVLYKLDLENDLVHKESASVMGGSPDDVSEEPVT